MIRSKKEKRMRMAAIDARLAELYPNAECALEFSGDPWRLLVMARLSAQCTDARVNIVCRDLFSKYPDAASMAAAELSDIENVVRPCGLYRTKAENIKEASRIIAHDLSGKIPDTMDGLLALPGVGRKIANLILGDVFGIPEWATDIVKYGDCVNLMKGAIERADRVTTVSPTYAEEIMDPWYSHELDGILKERSWKLSGIVNGIDTDLYNPETDPMIYKNYSVDNREGKKENKLQLQRFFGLPENADTPLIGMVTRLVSHKGLDLIKARLEAILDFGAQVVILGSGEFEYENFLYDMAARYPDKLKLKLGFIPDLAHKIYAGADIFLMPSKSEPCGLAQMVAIRYGTIPIVRATGGLRDTITDSGLYEGNGFVFENYNADEMAHAVYRAVEGYKNRDGWDTLVERAMRCDNSWGASANAYIKLYKSVL